MTTCSNSQIYNHRRCDTLDRRSLSPRQRRDTHQQSLRICQWRTDLNRPHVSDLHCPVDCLLLWANPITYLPAGISTISGHMLQSRNASTGGAEGSMSGTERAASRLLVRFSIFQTSKKYATAVMPATAATGVSQMDQRDHRECLSGSETASIRLFTSSSNLVCRTSTALRHARAFSDHSRSYPAAAK